MNNYDDILGSIWDKEVSPKDFPLHVQRWLDIVSKHGLNSPQARRAFRVAQRTNPRG